MNKRQKSILRILTLAFALFMIGTIGFEIFSTIETNISISQAKKEQLALKEEEENLKNEVAKLNDEKYLQSYVSGTIFSTEKGTTIFILPDQEEMPE